MKTLYLIRHAKSSWKNAHRLDDIDRPLNKRGKRDAPFMGKLLFDQDILPDVFISSPAKRAKSTAKQIATQAGYPIENILVDNRIYEASVNDLLKIVQESEDEWDSLAIFGHNYTYTYFANLYSQPPIENVATCAIVGIEYPIDSWQDVNEKNGKIVFFEYPRKYFPKK